jgi:hypothetical protein
MDFNQQQHFQHKERELAQSIEHGNNAHAAAMLQNEFHHNPREAMALIQHEMQREQMRPNMYGNHLAIGRNGDVLLGNGQSWMYCGNESGWNNQNQYGWENQNQNQYGWENQNQNQWGNPNQWNRWNNNPNYAFNSPQSQFGWNPQTAWTPGYAAPGSVPPYYPGGAGNYGGYYGGGGDGSALAAGAIGLTAGALLGSLIRPHWGGGYHRGRWA